MSAELTATKPEKAAATIYSSQLVSSNSLPYLFRGGSECSNEDAQNKTELIVDADEQVYNMDQSDERHFYSSREDQHLSQDLDPERKRANSLIDKNQSNQYAAVEQQQAHFSITNNRSASHVSILNNPNNDNGRFDTKTINYINKLMYVYFIIYI
jgi:hypothetical protein